MYNLDKDKLKDLIENSSFSSNQEKNKQIRGAFLSFFSELCDYSKSVNETILNQSLCPDRNGFLPDIRVALMDCEDGKKFGTSIGLAPMAVEGNRIFIDDEYENLKLLIGDVGERRTFEGQYIKDGQCHKFRYCLSFDRSYIERQELLYKYALHYELINPVMFSPYSFKSFSIVVDSGLAREDLDFRFHENGINAITSKEKDLFWNVSIVNVALAYKAKIPYGDDTRYIFEFPKSKQGNYVLPLPCNNQTKIYAIDYLENSLTMTTDRASDDFYVLEPLTIDSTSSVVRTLESSDKMTSNTINYNGIIGGRLLSEADIEHAIAPFRSNHGIKCHISQGCGEIAKRYIAKYRPDRRDRKLFHIISREYIMFEADKPARFLADYINYVLEYLEYYYPEIEWVGET